MDIEQTRIKAKYASKKKLWGRNSGGRPGAHPRSYPEEMIGHLKWIYAEHGYAAAMRFGVGCGMHKCYVKNVCDGSLRSTVPAVRGLHFG